MATIYIDNKAYTVQEGKNLLETCISLGLNLPYFCWHPQLGSVGACRQCAVKSFKDEHDTKGKIVMACMEPVKDGARISLEDEEVKAFHAGITEGFMTNHPHDCPTCDEGGQCHLQDMTVMTGHNYRRYRFNKRTFHNQYLGPFLNHEMNRCISCYRCVRFYKDYAGGNDLDVFGAHNHVYFGRYKDGPLESEFSGNLAEICPTGVFTDKTLKKHYTRKWDLTTAPSLCNQCSLGCNTIAGERYGSLRSITSRFNGEVNGYFLCDRGRFGYEYMNSDLRIRKPAVKNEAGNFDIQQDTLLMLDEIQKVITRSSRVIGIGSPRASVESNFALKKYVGADRFYSGMSKEEFKLTNLALEILTHTPAHIPSLKEIEKSDAVLILGEDLTNTAPMAALAARQTIRNKPLKGLEKMQLPEWDDKAIREAMQDEKGPLYIAAPAETKLDSIATKTLQNSPEEIARFGYAVAAQLSEKSPSIDNLSKETISLAKEVADALREADNPLIITGTSCHTASVMTASANIAAALCKEDKKSGLFITLPEANSLGLCMLGGNSFDELIDAENPVENETAIILENDLYRRAPADLIESFLSKRTTIVLDHTQTKTSDKANYLLSAAPVAESSGSLVNNEGRAQRFFQVYVPEHHIQPSWKWMQAVSAATGHGGMTNWDHLDDFLTGLEDEYPVFSGIRGITPPPGYRVAGQKIPRESHRYSGRTAMHANKSVHEPAPPADEDSPMTYTMEGFFGEPPAAVNPRYWSPGWNSVQAINKYQIEVGGHLHGGDPGKRLLEIPDDQHNDFQYYNHVPLANESTDDWIVLPLYHIYGSEEFSSKSEAVAERIPEPYLAANADDLVHSGIIAGSRVTLKINGNSFQLPVVIKNKIPRGMIGLPVGIPGLSYVKLPAKGKIEEMKK